MVDLKPCPFCGGEAERGDGLKPGSRTHMVYCMNCQISTGRGSVGGVTADWNSRPSPWISVEDRLPDPGEDVLIRRPVPKGQPIYAVWNHTCGDWLNQEGYSVGMTAGGPTRPTHWAPLPDPPE